MLTLILVDNELFANDLNDFLSYKLLDSTI